MATRNGLDTNGVSEPGLPGPPQYVDYDKLMSKAARRRQMPELRRTAGYMLLEGYMRMGGGFPNPEVFPITQAQFTLSDNSVLNVDPELLRKGLQYHESGGLGELTEWLLDFQKHMHNPPLMQTLEADSPRQFDVVLTNGGNEAMSLALGIFLDEGDFALCEDATYSTAMSAVAPIGAQFYGVKADEQGIVPEELERVLSSWSTLNPASRKPRALYAITSCGNPTGVTWSLARKQAVYAVARKHGLIILEDDAYYFLQFNRPLIPSFISMDVDGRVIRFDTFSKLIAPGMRVAFCSGPSKFLDKIRLQKDCGSLFPNGVSQVLLLQLLKRWGRDGFLKHVDSLMEFYKAKSKVAISYVEKHLSGLVEYTPPSGGFFLWLRVLHVADSEPLVQRALQRRLVAVAGCHFLPGGQQSPYIRLNYASSSEEEFDRAFKVLAEIIREYQKG